VDSVKSFYFIDLVPFFTRYHERDLYITITMKDDRLFLDVR